MGNSHEMTEREAYYQHVEVCVDVIQDVLRDDPGAEISELVWEQVDSSEYIIYYDKNLKVLRYSTNEPGEWKHLVSDSDSWREVIQALAYATMEQDLWEEVRNRDLD